MAGDNDTSTADVVPAMQGKGQTLMRGVAAPAVADKTKFETAKKVNFKLLVKAA